MQMAGVQLHGTVPLTSGAAQVGPMVGPRGGSFFYERSNPVVEPIPAPRRGLSRETTRLMLGNAKGRGSTTRDRSPELSSGRVSIMNTIPRRELEPFRQDDG